MDIHIYNGSNTERKEAKKSTTCWPPIGSLSDASHEDVHIHGGIEGKRNERNKGEKGKGKKEAAVV